MHFYFHKDRKARKASLNFKDNNLNNCRIDKAVRFFPVIACDKPILIKKKKTQIQFYHQFLKKTQQSLNCTLLKKNIKI